MQYISIAHSWFSWVILAAGLVAVLKQGYNLLTRQPYQERDKLFLTIFVRSLEIEAGLGAVLIVREIFFRDMSTSFLLHGLVGLVPLGLAYLLVSREVLWARKVKPVRVLLSVTALVILIAGIFGSAPAQPLADEVYTLSGHDEAVRSLEFSPDQRSLATASFDGTIRVWDYRSGEGTQVLSANNEPIRTISYSPDGEFLTSGSFDHQVSIWKMPQGDLVLDIPAHQASINRVIWAEDVIYSASLDNTIRVWDPETGDLVKQVEPNHTGGILSLALSPDGQTLASGGIDGTIQLHNTSSGSTTFLGSHAGWVYDLEFSRDGRLLVSGSLDGTVILWDLTTQATLFQSEPLEGAVQAVTLSPDASIILGGSADSKIYLWNAETSRLMDTLPGHQRGVLDLDFTDDGNYLASASADNTVIIWQISPP